jgi:uracil-DNA glycosylase family 4
MIVALAAAERAWEQAVTGSRVVTSWIGDPASPTTPVAHDADDVRRLASSMPSLKHLDARISVCRACPRLVAWREEVAETKRAAFRDEDYWGRPAPGFGVERPEIVVLGLAPAAHGANRTGRVFTGDRSGDWLFAALHRAGLANQPTSTHLGDGLALRRTRVLAAVRCAPPANKPTIEERDTCAPWMHAELRAVRPSMKVIVALGGFAWGQAFSALRAVDVDVPKPMVKFGHGAESVCGAGITVIGSFHPSQQNTFTGRLTEPMFDAVLQRAVELCG